MPTFSVALATYNGSRFLDAQLESISAQGVAPDEIIIGDDCSTDDTASIVEAFSRRHPGITTTFQRNAVRLGTSQNFEAIVRRCTGDVVVFSDQDDVWKSTRIERIAGFFDRDPQLSYVACNGSMIDEAGKSLDATLFSAVDFEPAERESYRAGHALEVLLRRNVITGAALAVRRTALLQLLPFEPGWVHDYFLAFALEALGHGVLLDEALIEYRRHAAQQLGLSLPALSSLLSIALRQDAAHCLRDAAKFRALGERLPMLGVPRGHWVLGALEDKARLCDTRARMRRRPREAPRLLWKAARAGEYRRLSLGWKQIAVDTVSVLNAVVRRGDDSVSRRSVAPR